MPDIDLSTLVIDLSKTRKTSGKRTPAKSPTVKKPTVKKPVSKARSGRKKTATEDKPKTPIGIVSTRKQSSSAPKPVNTKSTAADRAAELERLRAEADGLIEAMPSLASEDQAQLDQYRHMFDELINVSSILETEINEKRNIRAVYPLMQTYNQMREVIADMRALRDVGALGQRVNEELLNPLVMSIGQDSVSMFQAMRSYIFSVVSDAAKAEELVRHLNNEFKTLGSKIQSNYTAMLDKSIGVLGG